MAPRETIPVSTNGNLLSGVTSQAQRDALTKAAPPPYKPPVVDWELKDVPAAESTSTFHQTETRTQADTLRRAAESGTPFCEVCQAAKEQSNGGAAAGASGSSSAGSSQASSNAAPSGGASSNPAPSGSSGSNPPAANPPSGDPPPPAAQAVEPAANQNLVIDLTQPTRQAPGTWQCWWLSFLEFCRESHKLDAVFGAGGPFANAQVPQQNGKLVYGPGWQRVLMKHLVNSGRWNFAPTTTLPTSQRPAELQRLALLIGVQVTQGAVANLTASNVEQKLAGLAVGQRLVLDKKVAGGGHAISGIVEQEGSVRQIRAYCQQTQASYLFKVAGREATMGLKDTDQGAEANWFLPLT